jgi:Ca2+-binding RTX toxin-like protein
MASVTVHGATAGTYVVVTYDTAAYQALAVSLLASESSYATTGGYLVDNSGANIIPDGQLPVVGVGVPGNTGLVGLGSVTLTDQNTAANQLILSGNGTDLTFDATAGSGTVVAGDGTGSYNFAVGDWQLNNTPDSVSGTTVTAGSGFDLVAAGSGDSTVIGGSGTLFAFSSTGLTDYQLGTGGSYIIGGDGESSITGGTGTATVFGSDGTTMNFSGSTGQNYFIAGSGNETLNGSGATGSNLLYAGSGDDSLTAGSGNDTLFGGTGSSTLTGGSGQDVFAFVDQTGGSTSVDTVNDFTSNDFLMLIDGLSISSSEEVGNNLVDVLSDGTTLTFTDIASIASDQIITGG